MFESDRDSAFRTDAADVACEGVSTVTAAETCNRCPTRPLIDGPRKKIRECTNYRGKEAIDDRAGRQELIQLKNREESMCEECSDKDADWEGEQCQLKRSTVPSALRPNRCVAVSALKSGATGDVAGAVRTPDASPPCEGDGDGSNQNKWCGDWYVEIERCHPGPIVPVVLANAK